MSIEDKKEKLLFLQSFFAKSFWINLILLIIASLVCVLMHDEQLEAVQKLFNMDERSLNLIILMSLSMWKLLIIQFNLVPALVIWGIRKCCSCNCDCENK